MNNENCVCQVCGHSGVEMLDICEVCNWQNDFSLENTERVVTSVGYILSEDEKELWSVVNGDTPIDHYRRLNKHNGDIAKARNEKFDN